MYSDVLAYCNKCPECVVVTGAGHHHWPPLHPIIIQRGLFRSMVLRVQLNCLIMPFHSGWYKVVFSLVIPSDWQILSMRPLSVQGQSIIPTPMI